MLIKVIPRFLLDLTSCCVENLSSQFKLLIHVDGSFVSQVVALLAVCVLVSRSIVERRQSKQVVSGFFADLSHDLRL